MRISTIVSISFFLCCLKFLFAGEKHRTVKTSRPIIGILSQSTRGSYYESFGKDSLHIVASYVKFLESSGARVVPIRTDVGEEEFTKLYRSINGLLLPGGHQTTKASSYYNASKTLLELAVQTNDGGGYFPVLGICLGHQVLTRWISGVRDRCITAMKVKDSVRPLNLSSGCCRGSKMIGSIPTPLLKSNPTIATYHAHDFSCSLQKFLASERLKNFFRVLSTNIDDEGMEFVSTMEAKRYPFYSMQWHPEKSAFEWNPGKKIPHDATTIEFNYFISKFMVNEAKLNDHSFESETTEQNALIYNYYPVYTGRNYLYEAEQIYIL